MLDIFVYIQCKEM